MQIIDTSIYSSFSSATAYYLPSFFSPLYPSFSSLTHPTFLLPVPSPSFPAQLIYSSSSLSFFVFNRCPIFSPYHSSFPLLHLSFIYPFLILSPFFPFLLPVTFSTFLPSSSLFPFPSHLSLLLLLLHFSSHYQVFPQHRHQ